MFVELSLAIILGACAGSFAHAAAWRSVRGKNWIHARSACYACARPLALSENIPLIGYFRHWGACACKQNRLPMRYILVEFGAAALCGLSVFVYGSVASLVFAPYLIVLMVIFLTDLEAYRIPDWASLGGVTLALIFSAMGLSPLAAFYYVLGGAVAGFLLIHLINAAYKLWRKHDGLGAGDAKLMALIGAWSGIESLLPILFVASFAGALWGIILMLMRKAHSQSALPFGCFLVSSALLWYFCAPFLLE